MNKFFSRTKRNILSCYLLLGSPLFCYGETPATLINNNQTFLGKTLQTFAMLGIVIFLIFILGYVMRKLVTLRTPLGSAIKISSVLSLGMRERIALIEVKNVTLVVGITAGNITVLHVFPTPKKE